MKGPQKKHIADWLRTDPRLQHWFEEEIEKSDARIDPLLQNRILARIRRETVGARRFSFRAVCSAAAVLLLLLGTALLTYHLTERRQTSVAPFIVQADKGEKARIELPDGTSVLLNSDSQLSYRGDFGNKERRVELVGEACFEVAPDSRRTFVVQAGDLAVQVLGTTFNLSAYDEAEEVVVVLVRGKVEVHAGHAVQQMKPGDKLAYHKKNRQLQISTVTQPADYLEWSKGNLYFEQEPLKNILQALSRIYNVEMRPQPGTWSQETFTGTIPGSDLHAAMDILALTARLTYRMEGTTISVEQDVKER